MTAKKQGGNRRRKGEGSIFEEPSRRGWRYDGPEGTIRAKSETELTEKIQVVRARLAKKFKAPEDYTFGDSVTDWLEWLAGEVEDEEVSPNTLRIYRSMSQHLTEPKPVGRVKLNELSGADIERVLKDRRDTMTSVSLQLLKHVAVESVRYAATRKLADRDTVASVREARVPRGRSAGRPSKAMGLEKFLTLLEFSSMLWNELERPDRDAWLWPYVALTLLCGVRAEEARALLWDDVDLDEGVVWVRRSDRFKGQTKTETSKRRLKLDDEDVGVRALREQAVHQARLRVAAGDLWEDSGRVFTTALGAGMNDEQVRLPFKRLCSRAGIGDDWVPRETRKTFATLLKETGLEVADIAAALGHARETTTRKYYIEEAEPVLVDVSPALSILLAKAKLTGQEVA